MSGTTKTNIKIALTAIILLSGAYFIHSQSPTTKVAGNGEKTSLFSKVHADIVDPSAGK